MPETWTTLRFSRSEVKRAGKVLRDHAASILTHSQDEVEHATEILNDWRSAHAYALNAAQMGLRSRIRTTLEVQPQVAQRLKERPSIIAKLRRGAPRMQLSTMQDLAGCRGVVDGIDDVYRVAQRFHDDRLVDTDDYIAQPASSGYRGVHLIVRYRDRPTGDHRLVEIQLRTRIQHDWAVSVEDTGRRHGFALKQGEGPEEVLGYYRVASTALEQIERRGEVAAQVQRELARARDRANAVLRGG